MSHVTLWVDDQDEALKFYTEKLGFEVGTDANVGDFRWLTVTPPDQDLEIILVNPVGFPNIDDETAGQLRSLMKKGALGTGVMHTKDCQATYDELRSKGVEFIAPPQERPYGIEAVLKDNSGNWFSLTQPLEA
jgi:catechol 2,3-dioxygenase-like lactoylglutathione lyase family enzyme